MSIATIALTVDILIKNGISFNKEYLLEVFKDNLFQDVILIFIFNIFSYESELIYAAVGISGIIGVSNYFKDFLRIFMFMKKYFVKINGLLKKYLLTCKALLEIYIAGHLLVVMIVSKDYLIGVLFVVYLQFLDYKNNYNRRIKAIFKWVKDNIDALDNLRYFPSFITFILKMIRNFFVLKASYKF